VADALIKKAHAQSGQTSSKVATIVCVQLFDRRNRISFEKFRAYLAIRIEHGKSILRVLLWTTPLGDISYPRLDELTTT
jgi:hypothetical protein